MAGWHKVLYAGAWLTLGLALCLVGIAVWWGIYPYSGLQVRDPITVSPSHVQSGTLARYTVSYCVDQSLPVPISVAREMELQDGTGKTVLPIAPPISYLIEERCETRSMAFGIPTFAPTGTYHLHYITSLQVNPVRQVRQAFTSTEFEIVENESLKMDAIDAAKLVLEAAEVAKRKLAKEKN